MNTTIDHTERPGTLTWWAGFSKTEQHTMTGHFTLALDGHTIIARKRYGRNRWRLCDISDIASWQPQETTR